MAQSPTSDLSLPLNTCKECGYPTQKDIELLGVMKRVRVICRCRAEELQREEERQKRLEAQRRLNRFKAYSLMDERFEESTFENWVIRDDNRKYYDFGKRYSENWSKVYEGNHGILIHGSAGSGKTYLSFAIANALYAQGKSVMAISVSRILKIIMDSYRQHGEVGEIEILNTLSEASLLVLDDLGVEHKTNWSYEKLYSIIDTRYRAKKPTIITTNLRIENEINELRYNLSIVDAKTSRFDESDRIYNRIVEMCAFIEVEGESWRIQKGIENKKALFEKLGMKTG